MSFWATSFVIFMIMGVMMPGFGVAHHHDNVMPVGKTVAQGYHFGPANAMSVIIIVIISQIQWLYIINGVDKIPDASDQQKRFLKYFYWISIVALGLLFIIPPVRAKIGPFQYGLHEIASDVWMTFTAFFLITFAQWCETNQGRHAIVVGSSIGLLGMMGNLIESGIHNARHGGPFQFFGLAVLLGTFLMTMFGCENYTFTLINATGFEAERAVVASSKSTADESDYAAV